ncbi:MAG: leucine-rich repeat protein, partial [Clostridia bacterium]|nr:leucine-rich repeat protein [Clostridia bacterium]
HIYDAQSGESITEFASRPVSGTFELSAFLDDRFNEGTTYGFFLWVNGPGYDGNGIDGTFTVVPGSAESFTLSTAKILTGESFQYFITTSANDVRVKIGDDSIEDVVTNEPAEISMWGYDAGTYTVTAQKKNGSTWSNIGTAQKIEVVKIGTMDTPKANIPAYVYDGSDLKITNVLENLVDGGWYQVVLSAMSGEDGFEMIKDTNSEGNSDTVVFPASVLEAGKEYMVCVQYYAFGYDCKDDQVAFVRILDAAFETPDFVLPAALTEIDEEAFEGIAASVVKVPDKVKTIGSKAFANAVNLRQIQIPASVTSIAGDAFEGTSVAIFGVENSYAHTWAVSHGFPFYWD